MKTGHAIITFLGGLYFVLFYLTPEATLESFGVMPLHEYITQGFIVIGTMACGIGLINIIRTHVGTIVSRKKSASLFSAILLFGLFSTIGFGVADWIEEYGFTKFFATASAYASFFESHPGELTPQYQAAIHNFNESSNQFNGICKESSKPCQKLNEQITALDLVATAEAATAEFRAVSSMQRELLDLRKQQSLTALAVRFFNEGVFIPLGSSMFSLLAFYIASSAFQAFRIRSVESALLMLAATLVIIGQSSLGSTLWSGFPVIRNWLMTVPNTAAFRAISLGASVASFILAIRIWLSLDSSRDV